jgi:phospholipase D1/2
MRANFGTATTDSAGEPISARTVLTPGRNSWRVEQARRAAVLVDAAAYYGALRAAMRRARHSITIIGWDIDSRTPLVGPRGVPDDGLPKQLGDFLCALVRDHPQLSIRLLLWNYSLLYATEREPLPLMTLQWTTPRQIELCLDDEIPVGSSHHQKIVVIDDALAFVGGLDLTIRRWDTSVHAPTNEHRVDPGGVPYSPFHDVQMMVDGPAAVALAALARWRWKRAADETLPLVVGASDPWPDAVTPDFRDIAVGISRTLPSYPGEREIREVEAMFEDMIESAETTIYIENQFLTCTRLAMRLAARMQAMPVLETVIVGPHIHNSWIEHRAMVSGRARFIATLRSAGVGDRIRLLHPRTSDDGVTADIMVHSKLMIVDDRLLRIGSANLCNRSMAVDSECDLTIEAADDDDRRAITALRNRLLAEHCGIGTEEMAERIADIGSVRAAIDGLAQGQRCLQPIDDGRTVGDGGSWSLAAVADPHRPLLGAGVIERALSSVTGRWRALLRLAPVILAAMLLILAWRTTTLAEWTRPDLLQGALQDIGNQGLAPVLVIGLFVLAGLVMFPVTVLIADTAAAFGAWPGVAYAGAGALASALVSYFVGRGLGEAILRDAMGPRLSRIRGAIARRGIIAVTSIRLVPIAPFTLVNLAAGAARIPIVDYTMGTALGLAPGLITLSALGDRIMPIFRAPSLRDVSILIAVIIAWIALSIGLQALVMRRRQVDR